MIKYLLFWIFQNLLELNRRNKMDEKSPLRWFHSTQMLSNITRFCDVQFENVIHKKYSIRIFQDTRKICICINWTYYLILGVEEYYLTCVLLNTSQTLREPFRILINSFCVSTSNSRYNTYRTRTNQKEKVLFNTLQIRSVLKIEIH